MAAENAPQPPRNRGGADVVPAALAALVAVVALAAAPTAAVLHDQLRDWQAVFGYLSSGQLPRQGAVISGVGANGPLYYLLLMAGQILSDGETGLALFVTAAAVLGTALWAWTASSGEERRLRLWMGVAVASHPLVMEWVRMGSDFSYLPVLLPAAALFWRAVERRSGRPLPWLAWGVVCGAALQLHVTTVPLLLIASWALWRLPRWWCAPLLTLVGTALTFATRLSGLEWTGRGLTWWSLPETAMRLLGALVAAAEVPAEAIGLGGVAGVWTTIALFAMAVTAWRLGDAVARLLSLAALGSLAFVAFDSGSHYNHLMHLDMVLVAGLAAGARVLASRSSGRIVLIILVSWQVAVSLGAALEAQRTGLVRRYTAFPLAWPGVREESVTAAFRDRLAASLRAEGLSTPWERHHRVVGDTLPLADSGWVFLGDPSGPPPFGSEPPRSAGFLLSREPCASRNGHALPGHCLISDGSSPDAYRAYLGGTAIGDGGRSPLVTLAQARHAWIRERRAFPETMPPLIIDWVGNYPKALTAASGERIRGVTLRQFRFPDAVRVLATVRLAGAGEIHEAPPVHGYLLQERRYRFPQPATSLTIVVEGAGDRGAFDLEVDLDRSGDTSSRPASP